MAANRSQGRVPAILAFFLVTLAVISLTLGQYPISLSEQWFYLRQALTGTGSLSETQFRLIQTVLLEIRVPRLLAAVLVGAALSVSGAAFQAMFVNPLVSPGLLGVLAGSAFGAALGMLWASSWLTVQAYAFAGGILAVCLSLGFARCFRGDRLLLLVLGGVISASLFTALLSAVKYVADPTDQLPAITYWLMGGLSRVDRQTIAAASIPLLGGLVGLCLFGRHLDVLSLGDDEARGLGLEAGRVRLGLIMLATVLCALTVSIAGLVGWVGLLVPHASRALVGPDNRRLLPVTALLGGGYLLLVDDLARLALGVEIPLGILTALLGIPFFPVVLANARRGWR
ncbi:FecCD family ABC transporter permease [Desulfovibrio inopinatus]|uniref:FecCD family ABC transporter permease n=1 Tax=Desulfovibrio inopinatus TaxID=102109 RepID=UPI000484A1F8|nr:iron ABC transporter permease [Desulfovibrio inopinatus]